MEAYGNQNPRSPIPFSSEEQREEKGLMMNDAEFEEIQKITGGYKFNDLRLLQQAFTDSSYKEEGYPSYERLEYIGDSVLNLLVAKEHFLDYPDLSPGKLTRLRAANVDTEKLARVALRWDLPKYLRHRKPLLDRQIEEFSKAILDPLHSTGLVDPPKVLADIVESLIGAIFMDCNFSLETTWQVVKNLLQPMITSTTLETHPVTKLYELCQKNALKTKLVDSWEKKGEFEIYLENECVGRGQYKSKKLIAINRAALDAYNKIFKKLSPPVADA